MYLEENQIGQFRGTQQYNSQGKDLKTFLEEYDPKKYDNPCNTVDTLVFTYDEKQRKIKKLLLIKRGNHPSIGMWALPGGFVEYREDLDQAALRELKEETGVENIEVEQLKSYGAYDRDPRTRIITTAYVAIVPEGSITAQAADDASDSGWFDIKDELVSVVTDDAGITRELHNLELTHDKDQGVVTKSTVEITYKKNAILKNVNYKVINTEMLASDHGALILEGYHYICKALDSVSSINGIDK